MLVENCAINGCEAAIDYAARGGAAILLLGGTNGYLRGCELIANAGDDAVSIWDQASLSVDDTEVSNGIGGIVSHSRGAIALRNSVIAGNSDTGVDFPFSFTTLYMERCVVVDNTGDYGGGVSVFGTAHIVGCTLSGNTSSVRGGGVYSEASDLVVESTILSGNRGAIGSDLDVTTGHVAIYCSALDSTGVNGWSRISLVTEEQIWEDPRFCDGPNCPLYAYPSDYRLSADSPCTAWSSPCGQTVGALEAACGAKQLGACCVEEICLIAPPDDCEALDGHYQGDGTDCAADTCHGTPTVESTWGAIKHRFRE